jgi:hypothetical protein
MSGCQPETTGSVPRGEPMSEPVVPASEAITPPNGFPQPQWSPPPPPRRTGRGWLLFGLGVVTGATVLGAIWLVVALPGAAAEKSTAFELKGTMTLVDPKLGGGSTCYGTGGYKDISEGSAVTVYGAGGNVVATGSLGRGTKGSSYDTCVFTVSVPNVPGDEKFYQVEVTHRGKLTIEAADAKAVGVAATLGG